MVELTAERTVFGKLYDMGGRKRRVVVEKRPQHYPDDENKFQDIDTVPRVSGKSLVVDRAWGKSTIPDNEVKLDYESRVLGTATMRLAALDDVLVENLTLNIAPKIEGSSIFWRDLVPDLDLELRFWPARFEWFKYLKSATAPRSLTWEMLLPERKDRSFTLQEISRGWDSRKTQADLSDGRRWAKMQIDSTPIIGGVKIREEFLNAVMDVEDPVTRIRTEKTDVLYPVIIDVEVDEDIVATADDQYDRWTTGSTFHSLVDGSLYYRLQIGIYQNRTMSTGLRFQTVAIPAGATIDDATLNVYVQSTSEGNDTMALTLVGAEEDDAPAWSTSAGHRPADMQNPTTATAGPFAFAALPAGGNNWAIDMTAAVVQEMIDDPASWASGNDMRMALQQTTDCGLYGDSAYLADYSHGSNPAPNFVVNYTAAGGARPQGPLGHPLHGPFAGPIN